MGVVSGDRTAELDQQTVIVSETGSSGASGSSGSSDVHAGMPRGAAIGRYVVIEELGRGGMGEVFLAYDPELDRRVALKLVRPTKGSDARQRLVREAQALARLSHPNVVAVHDVGTHEDRVFIAMEYVQGQTLQQWLQAEDRSWQHIVDMSLRAGRGLAAAHAAGLVHRDFKPANVMVGDDGRVRVLDFGLARRADALSTVARSKGGHDSRGDVELDATDEGSTLTVDGVVMGTPAFMAPEQFVGTDVDERSDQFAFCVVLFRALYGAPPFQGKSYEKLVRAVVRGAIEEPKRSGNVPRRLRQIVGRGLSVRPDARYPCMNELLRSLERVRRGNKRRVAIVGAICGTAAVSVTAGAFASGKTPCSDVDASMQALWGSSQAEGLREAFAASQVPHASEMFERVEPRIDTWSQQWVSTRRDACEATQIRGEQSASLMDLRMACLDRKLHDLRAVVEVLGQPDTDVVHHAAETVAKLPSLQECSDVDRLHQDIGFVPAEHAEEVERLREELALLKAKAHAGKYGEVLDASRDALARAEGTEYLPIVAESAQGLGHIEERSMLVQESRASYARALEAAAEVGYGEYEALSLIGLVGVGAYNLDPNVALDQARHAAAVVRRLGDPPRMVSPLLAYQAAALAKTGDLAGAIEHYRSAAQVEGANPHNALAAMINVAPLLAQQGKHREALRVLERAAKRAEGIVGEHHPSYGTLRLNIGALHLLLGDHDQAREEFEQARATLQEAFGPSHPHVAQAHQNLGAILDRQGDLGQALQHYEKALEIKLTTLGADHASVGFAQNNVGDVLVRMGRPADGLPYLNEARRIWGRAEGAALGWPTVAANLGSLASAHLGIGDPAAAYALAKEGLDRLEEESDPAIAAQLWFASAQAQWRLGRTEEARQAATRAEQAYHASEQPMTAEIEAIQSWLRERS